MHSTKPTNTLLEGNSTHDAIITTKSTSFHLKVTLSKTEVRGRVHLVIHIWRVNQTKAYSRSLPLFQESMILIRGVVFVDIRRSVFLEFKSPRTYDLGFRFFVNQKYSWIGPVRGSETRAHDIFPHTEVLDTRRVVCERYLIVLKLSSFLFARPRTHMNVPRNSAKILIRAVVTTATRRDKLYPAVFLLSCLFFRRLVLAIR